MSTPLDHTRYDDVWAVVEGRAHGYQIRDGALVNIRYDDHSAYAAGGLRSTVDDLSKWHEAYIGGRLIPSDLLEAALHVYAGPYGYGWQVIELFDRPMHNHTGGIGGFSSHLAYYPDDDVLIIVLSNVEDENTKGTACDLAAILFDAKPVPEANQKWLKQANTARCHQKLEE